MKKTSVCFVAIVLISSLAGCAVKPASIDFNEAHVDINVGETVALGYSVSPKDASTGKIYIEISNTDCLSSMGNNAYKGESEGITTVSILYGDTVFDTCEIEVHSIPVESISFTGEESEIGIGRSQEAQIEISPSNATYKDYSLSSSNEEVAKVDGTSIIAVAEGKATITATASNRMTTEQIVSVVPVNPEAMNISAEETTIMSEDSAQLSVIYCPLDVTYADVSWKSSNNRMLSVSEDGIITAGQVGTATITATHKTGITAYIDIEVLPIPVERVTITANPSKSVYCGKSIQLTSTVYPENATDKSIAWSSNNPSIASVTSSGKVSTLNSGSATITATTSNGVSSSYDIAVKPTTKDMTVSISATCSDYNSVGNEWTKSFSINGERASSGSTVSVTMDSYVSISTTITEEDNIPDVGSDSYSCMVQQNYFEGGFNITQTINVRENRGRYSGNVATWTVVYTFS